MLDFTESKTSQAGISNVRFHHSGFLTYEHVDQPVDAVSTTFAFHHLPDFWKGIALKRLNRMLKAGGQLYIHDVIIAEDNAIGNIDALIEKLSKAGGQVMRDDTERHFREEYSTYEWVMDGLLSRSDFTIKSKRIVDGVLGTYICTKN
jgi:putative AdoMet-dependent methyltransferase